MDSNRHKRRSRMWSQPLKQAEHESALTRGVKICRECAAPVPKGRRCWCSDGCMLAFEHRIRPVREMVYERDGGKCADCSKECPRGDWEADHITPLCEGGEHSLGNFRTLCVDCHRARTSSLNSRRFRGIRRGAKLGAAHGLNL